MASFKWNIDGFEEIRRSPEIQGEVMSLADSIAQSAGAGYVSSGQQRKSRFGAIVYAESNRAYGDQLRHNTLQKVLFSRKGG